MKVDFVSRFKSFKPKMLLAPSFCGQDCFRVIIDMSDCTHLTTEWKYREYVIENLLHEAPGAPKIFGLKDFNIFIFTFLANGSLRLIRMFSTVAGASKSKTPSFVEPIASRIAKKTNNYYYDKLFSCVKF